MNKLFLFALLSFSFLVFSCDDDDNGGDNSNNCQTCAFETQGTVVNTEYCDNGDGSATVTTVSSGQSNNIDLGTLTFEQYIAQLESGGFNCD